MWSLNLPRVILMSLMSKILWLCTLLLPSTHLLLESLHLLHYPSHFLTSGNNKVVQLYDMSMDKVLMSLKGHPKKINHIALHKMQDEDTLILSASADQIHQSLGTWHFFCRIHSKIHSLYAEGQTYRFSCSTNKFYLRSLLSTKCTLYLTLQPLTKYSYWHFPKSFHIASHSSRWNITCHCSTNKFYLHSPVDKTYSLLDFTTFNQIFLLASSKAAFTSLAIHPDGTLLALGTLDDRTGICVCTDIAISAYYFCILKILCTLYWIYSQYSDKVLDL